MKTHFVNSNRQPGDYRMPERKHKPPGPSPFQRKDGDDPGPSHPNVNRPDNRELLERMRKVDPNQSKRYRQRTGE